MISPEIIAYSYSSKIIACLICCYLFYLYVAVITYLKFTENCSDAPIMELADFPINRYLMADNSRYQ